MRSPDVLDVTRIYGEVAGWEVKGHATRKSVAKCHDPHHWTGQCRLLADYWTNWFTALTFFFFLLRGFTLPRTLKTHVNDWTSLGSVCKIQVPLRLWLRATDAALLRDRTRGRFTDLTCLRRYKFTYLILRYWFFFPVNVSALEIIFRKIDKIINCMWRVFVIGSWIRLMYVPVDGF